MMVIDSETVHGHSSTILVKLTLKSNNSEHRVTVIEGFYRTQGCPLFFGVRLDYGLEIL